MTPTTQADKAGIMVYDGDELIYIAGFSSLRDAQREEAHVLAFVREVYEVYALTTKFYEVK